MKQWRRQAAEGTIRAGMTITFSRTFTEKDLHDFALITRDYNPCHFDQRFCEMKKFTGPVCHGLLVGSMICEPGGQWGWLASEMSFKFVKPVYVGDTITCVITIKEVTERGAARAEAVFTNQQGEIVLTGALGGILPSGGDREVMSKMMEEGDPTNPLRDE
jgi:3-hydroxybutyryl-CoA dehydratase